MTLKPTISDLLALRDGEPLTAEARQAISEDPEAAERLLQLQTIKSELAQLPDVVPDDAVWEQIQAQIGASGGAGQPSPGAALDENTPSGNGAPGGGWQMRYPMATAAGVFFAAVLVSLLWLPKLTDGVSGQPGNGTLATSPVNVGTGPLPAQMDPGATVDADAMMALIDRSQRLEAVARLPVANAVDGQERSRQALLYRIADLDAQLNSLIEEEPMNPELKEKLWRQRVALLETLVAVQQEQLSEAAGLY